MNLQDPRSFSNAPHSGRSNLLEIKGLTVDFEATNWRAGERWNRTLHGIDLTISEGEALGIVGESGSGKSLTWLAALRLLGPKARIEGDVLFNGREFRKGGPNDIGALRGRHVGMIFQDPVNSLNPIRRIGDQICETLALHRGINGAAARAEALELLERVGIPDAAKRLNAFPFEFSGGMCQRVSIAIALAARPNVLVADEPTTALDVTVQAQVLDLLATLRRDLNMAVVLISHDLDVVAGFCDRIAVMQQGSIVEWSSSRHIFAAPRHPYTRQLVASYDAAGSRSAARAERGRHSAPPVVLTLKNITRSYNASKRMLTWGSKGSDKPVVAVSDVTLTIREGETVGLIGESGSGKSTLGRVALGIDKPDTGQVLLHDREIVFEQSKAWRLQRRDLQLIHQNPLGALNPKIPVGDQILEPLLIHKGASGRGALLEQVVAMAEAVGLGPELLQRYPQQLSGGQRQRVAIARAAIINPQVIICDEAVSALDASIRGKVLELLKRLQRERNISYLFISHDLNVVSRISHRVAVMYLGTIVELGTTDAVMTRATHPYTKALVAAIPDRRLGREGYRPVLKGEPPSAIDRPSGCPFQDRCSLAQAECRISAPSLRRLHDLEDHWVACHRAEQSSIPIAAKKQRMRFVAAQ